MFAEVKTVLEFVQQKHAVRFSYLFKNVVKNLSPLDQKKLQDFLIDQGIVENFESEGNEFGREAEYSLTHYGNRVLTEMTEYVQLDKLLAVLATYKGKSYLSMEELCKAANVPFSKTHALRLEGDGMVE